MRHDNDENEGRRLLRPLAGEPVTDPRIDVAMAMRRGAQVRRRHRVASGAAYAAVLAVAVAGGLVMLPALGDEQRTAGPRASSSASAGPSDWAFGPSAASGAPPAPEGAACGVQDFPVPDALLYLTDPTGRWSVTDASFSQFVAPQIFDNGVPAGSVTVPGQSIRVEAMNASGDAAVTKSGVQLQPWAFVDGVMTQLRGGAGAATAISSSGRFGGVLGTESRPVVWDGPDADPVELPMPEGFGQAVVIGITDDGTVVGALSDLDGGREVMTLWLPGGTTRPVVEQNAWPVAMSDGWVVGHDRDGRGFRYEIAADRYELLPGQLAAPAAVTGDGTVAGLSDKPYKADYGRMPYLLTGTEARPLEQPGDAVDFRISGMTGDGRTVFGTIETTDGSYRAVTWSC